MDRTDKTGLYFHIPFCRGKCPYCDFYSLNAKSCPDEYVFSLLDEMKTFKRMSELVGKDSKIAVDTIYFGGGTPSLLSPTQLDIIMDSVRESFNVCEEPEITVECNPSSPNLEEFLLSASKSGVNRISLGMQSSSDKERRKLGRQGNAKKVEDAVYYARMAGIENISLDVMVGVPESSLSSLRETLDFCLSLSVPHISAYMLKIEEGTFYYKNADKLTLPSEDEVCDMYLFMSHYLKENGFLHYEISNFCKEGFHSRHNMKYWEGAPYLGFGPAAHSFYNNKRFYFPRDIDAFIRGEKAIYDGEGGDTEEEILLHLRTYKGISLENKSSSFINKAKLFEKNGFAEITGNNFVLTSKGFLVSNTIISELLSVY
ncbi:MAG: radical SAM family heme chaperone HemW [Clostridia bacterium]|nr:radical SAM family heme chaperone HemW [Clostridia bacterium]